MNFKEHDRKSLDCFEQTIIRNMDFNVSANYESEGSEKHSRENLYSLRK